MAGIYGIWSKKKLNISNLFNMFFTSSFDNIINEEYKYNTFIYGRSTINKFINDRMICETNDLIIVFEGIFFNKEHEKSCDTIQNWYSEYGIDFVKKIKGQFSGFIYDKKINKLYVFNDHLSTKPIYYFFDKNVFIFSSELKFITKLQKKLKIEKKLDYDAVYSMLTFGYMLDDITYEKYTKKLNYATILEIDMNFKIKYKQYFKYIKKENYALSKSEIIEKIDNLLVSSIKSYWKKNDEYNYSHYAFLSGGLDSRVNIFLAKELGYNDINTITFSQSKSSDDTIAKKIAKNENFNHQFFSLDDGRYLENDLRTYINANDGIVNFQGAAAGFNILKNVQLPDLGAIHSGQIGDVLFGSFVKNKFSLNSGIVSNQNNLLKKISFFKEFQEKYNNNSEIFSFEQRQQNNTFNGDRTYSHFTDLFSPFYDRELIEFCLTIPDKYKKDEAIYLDWFNKKHKHISDYEWENAGIKPYNIKLVKLAKIFKRYKNGVLRRLGFNINDMNPFDIWLRNNPKILENLDSTYNKLINTIKDLELKEMLIKMYNTDIKYSHYGRNNKFLVVTFLLAYELHFGEID